MARLAERGSEVRLFGERSTAQTRIMSVQLQLAQKRSPAFIATHAGAARLDPMFAE
jgi:hypothetical protein